MSTKKPAIFAKWKTKKSKTNSFAPPPPLMTLKRWGIIIHLQLRRPNWTDWGVEQTRKPNTKARGPGQSVYWCRARTQKKNNSGFGTWDDPACVNLKYWVTLGNWGFCSLQQQKRKSTMCTCAWATVVHVCNGTTIASCVELCSKDKTPGSPITSTPAPRLFLFMLSSDSGVQQCTNNVLTIASSCSNNVIPHLSQRMKQYRGSMDVKIKHVKSVWTPPENLYWKMCMLTC